jgi:cobalt-zinc-cadmium efflux system membrane fusion protein
MPDATPVARPSVWSRLLHLVSGLVVTAGLVGVAYWGHRSDWRFVEHGLPRDAHTDRESVAVVEGDPPTRLRLTSVEAAERAGIDVTPSWEGVVTDTVTAPAEITFDPTRVARLSSRVPGTAVQVLKRVGDPVKAGDVLAVVESSEVGRAKTEFHQSLIRKRQRERALAAVRAGGAVTAPQVPEAETADREAEALVLAAEQVLANLGLPVRAADYSGLTADEVTRKLAQLGLPTDLARDGPPDNLLVLRSATDGVVTERNVVAGEVVGPAAVLFVVTDPTTVGVTLAVSAVDLPSVAVGMPMRFVPHVGPAVDGRVAWVGKTADGTTRTVPVRGEFRNSDGRLRAGGFGTGRVVVREVANAVLVPAAAVIRDGGTEVVFVRDENYLQPGGPKVFHRRVVRTGVRDGPTIEIRSGVAAGEVVASKGVGVLLGELNAGRPPLRGGAHGDGN